MLLLEADGKRLFEQAGISIPSGIFIRESQREYALPGSGPWIAKAQVPVGGRGKAGGVKPLTHAGELPELLRELFGLSIRGCKAQAVLVEQACSGDEHYLALMVDPASGGARLMYSPHGGMEVESHAGRGGSNFNESVALDEASLLDAVMRMTERVLPPVRAGLQDVGKRLVSLFLKHRLMLAEINPLFATPQGRFVAGDAKVVLDMNAVATDYVLAALLGEQRDLYPDAWRKMAEDFDFVEIDPQGQVGLITTGAGLSMMLIDELVGQGLKPFNFCDVRSGQMRGSPARLLRILDWLGQASDVRVVLVNIFAGITDLSEFTELLVQALKAKPDLRWPLVARLVGNGEGRAREIIGQHPELMIFFEPDLERAIARTARLLEEPDRLQRKEASHAA